MPVPPGAADAALLTVPDGWPGVSGEAGELAVVTRSGFIESRHFGHAAVVDDTGALVRSVGDPDTPCFPRSSLKPFQAAAVLLAGADLVEAPLAIAAASHRGHPDHVALVTQVLADIGLSVEDLQTPPALPSEEWARARVLRADGAPTRVAMNCSGKHAGMLAACVAAGWDPATYRDPDHPLQRLARRVVEMATGVEVVHVGVDGCGAPLFSTTIRGLATAMGTLGAATAADPKDGAMPHVTDPDEVTSTDIEIALGRIGRAMRAHPWTIAGVGADDTIVMQELDGVVAKGGAEAIMALGSADGFGVGLKVLDGNDRAAMVAGLALLATTGVDTRAVADAIAPRTLGHGDPVGRVHASAFPHR
ncbi:MAG TPA: asparaginase [Nitriliruptoraceae bacterium]|nr:asparaginase [Nitriliruptoraceae bacterium]